MVELLHLPRLFATLGLILAIVESTASCQEGTPKFSARSVGQEEPDYQLPKGITYEYLRRVEPRPLRIHIARIDLEESGYSLGVHAMPDPDGKGPAETELASPLVHCEKGRFILGVNANAWSMIPDAQTGQKSDYVVGGYCDVVGLAAVDGDMISPGESSWSFWIDADGRPGIGPGTRAPDDLQLAISGFGKLVEDGKVSGKNKPLHPRTALGLSEDRKILTLVVVDGRSPFVSEGLSLRELAELTRELGCHNSLNLDGGGSTIMILRDKQGELRVVNRPSGWSGPRPIPIMLGVRVEK